MLIASTEEQPGRHGRAGGGVPRRGPAPGFRRAALADAGYVTPDRPPLCGLGASPGEVLTRCLSIAGGITQILAPVVAGQVPGLAREEMR